MTYSDYGIQIPLGKYSGEVPTICPKCSHTRKPEHQKIKCLGVNLDKKCWRCNHCQWEGGLPPDKIMENKTYIKPKWRNNTELSDKLTKWFEYNRKIKQTTLTNMKITEGKEFMPQTGKEENTIQFNYFRDGELINTKFRDGAKNFKMVKDAELIFYNLDCLKNQNECYITEGEMDALTLIQCGFPNTVSVPNGANKGKNNLQYVDNCIDLFNGIETIYLALDNDLNGRKLREDLADRFGKDRCKYIEFKDKKDINEVLVSYGLQAVIECAGDKKEFPLEGIHTISTFSDEIDDMYINGLERGCSLGMGKIDTLIRFVKGYITVITGIPGMGKSDYLDQIILKLLINHGWKCAYYSPENKPTKLHFSKLARKLVGKNWFGKKRLSEQEKNSVKNYLEGKIWFLRPEKDFTLDTILDQVKVLKKRHGIDCFVIDAWNRLEHKYGKDETKYVKESLVKLDSFCELHNVHCFLVAHPVKMEKDKAGKFLVPNLYSINGSSHFYNIVANGMTIYRDYVNKKVIVYVQKVKFSHWGEIGEAEYVYDLESGRFWENIGEMAKEDRENWITKSQVQTEMPIPKTDDIIINQEIDDPF
jgi:twinkle protein